MSFFEEQSFFNDSYFLKNQLITYLGNKRKLLPLITQGINYVKTQLNKKRLDTLDAFSGSGAVSRLLKLHSNKLYTNDFEKYPYALNNCYLANRSEINLNQLKKYNKFLRESFKKPIEGVITKLYAPKNDNDIQPDEHTFYTHRNALYIDTIRYNIDFLPPEYKRFFLAPLIYEASVHTNTGGVFRGFYKNSKTGVGQFGGNERQDQGRILSDIHLPLPVFSLTECEYIIYNEDINSILDELPEIDLAYFDPPYNEHPYGANYFMLNVITDNVEPKSITKGTGAPTDWKRSLYNKRKMSLNLMRDLVSRVKAKYLLISFSNEGFIDYNEMVLLLSEYGKLKIIETNYTTFGACRNMGKRNKKVKEYLYILNKG
jgi:adenine-specific DNA-methyltransferase